MNNELKMEMYVVIKRFRHLSISEECPPFGICFNLSVVHEKVWRYLIRKSNKRTLSNLKLMFISWPHFSGNFLYPVPSGHSEVSPMDAYNNGDRWRGEYGKLRRNLCLHIADWLENRIKECDNEDKQ